MQCQNCGIENREGAKFCNECGNSLTKLTQSSGSSETKSQPQKMDVKAVDSTGTSPDHSTREAERRQLTVMFCDLVGSTALSEQLDPEELRDLIREYQSVCAEVISRYEGHIAKYLGDGLLVYFGYPMAHEDDARRAVHTGLEIVGDMEKLDARLKKERGISLAIRIGIHTGLVVAGEMGGGDVRESLAIVGETPNIAARLEGVAEPDTVVISPATYQLIEGYFECKSMGLHTLKGISQPMEVYKVLHKTGVQSRLDLSITKGLTPLVGREQEVELLLERWEQVKNGNGHLMLLGGEAGIGKSRLLQILKERVSGEPHIWIESRCSAYYQNSPYYPIIERLQRQLNFKREDSPEEKLLKLESELQKYGFDLEETVPLIASLLSLTLSDKYPPFNLDPERRKQKILETLLKWLKKEAEKHPVIRIIEDLHWVDPSTLDYLSLLVDRLLTFNIFILFTFRPDFNPPWTMRSFMTQITLNRLGREQAKVMIDSVAGGKDLHQEIVLKVLDKTDGVPLFVEELTKMILESKLINEQNKGHEISDTVSSLSIPTTLQDLLMARLDRLASAKEVAQLGATLGRDFSYDLIKAVSTLDDITLRKELETLINAELLFKRGTSPNDLYVFKHSLLQEAAYESMLRKNRRKYHQDIAKVLEVQFPEIAENRPELLAHHYTEGGLVNEAVNYWRLAGEKATEQSAHTEAVSHLNKGITLIKKLPDTSERTEKELALQVALGAPLRVTKGFAAPEVEKVYARSRELCKQVGETPKLFTVMRGMIGFYIARADFQTSYELGEELLNLAHSSKDPAFLIQAHYVLGATLFCVGEINKALEHTEQAYNVYDPQLHSSEASLYGQDPGVACLFWLSWSLWYLGYPDRALSKAHEALKLAQGLSHPYSIAVALNIVAFIYQFRGEIEAALKPSESSVSLSTEGGFGFILPMGTSLHGWALADGEKTEEGITQMQEGIAAWRKTGAELFLPYWLCILAETYFKNEKKEEALIVLEEAQQLANKNNERYYEAELYRLKGELLLEFDGKDKSEPERCFIKAIEISRKQDAKSLELRAVTSYSRLLQTQGKKEEARHMLEEIYGWFTEGFNTKDLKEGKVLLKEL